MTNAYYSSLSGMLAASYGLQNTSNNIANMQSHGFKRSEVFYSSLGNGHGEEGSGHGVRVHGSSINFKQGNHQETGTGTDLAIVGNGFFVIKLKNNELVYTRDGHFKFENGVLTDYKTGGQVQGYDDAGNLASIYEKGPKISAGKATRNVFIHGKFIYQERNPKISDSIYEDISFELKDIYDAQGNPHTVTLRFTDIQEGHKPTNTDSNTNPPAAPTAWELKGIKYDKDNEILTYGQIIKFDENGFFSKGVLSENSTIQLSLNGQPVTVYFGDGNNGLDQYVELGKPSSEQSTTTTIEIHQNDGYPQGTQYELTIDEEGLISYHYTNEQIIKGIYIGIAKFDDMENNLIQTQDNFFRAKTTHGIHYGHAKTKELDVIKSGNLEASNVDPTMEFANIVVLQRMFQACSQIMDIDKQLLEELETKL
ncbi:flagellar hook-basal body complex protein [Legionella saoudiensis]|uniref:flagellar hook-basal body complex protein n=1 Tax=Legionella saoudiensis TaxID=1750561 RepID=UPI0007317D61|nr:flagellar hook-basal body complex protein [Legionella saoudiensis]